MKTESRHPRLKWILLTAVLCGIVLVGAILFISPRLNRETRDAESTYGIAYTDQQILSLLQPKASGTVQFVLRGSPEPVCPCVSLDPAKQSFQFSWSALSSYLAMGKYTLTDGILTLATDGGTETYTFVLQDGTLVFDAKKSSPIPEYRYGEGKEPECPVPDGAVFHLQPLQDQ